MEVCVATARAVGECAGEDDLGKLEESIQALINARSALFYYLLYLLYLLYFTYFYLLTLLILTYSSSQQC